MPNTLVLIHGYSDKGESFAAWRDHLKDRYENTEQVCICDYVSLTNEVTIKDLAEGFDLALRQRPGLSDNEDFDAIVHSTGMLVIRSWLTTYPARRSRLKHLIGLAPATFGSPLARKGRSVLGAIFKGSKHLGPDFLAAGDLILDGLELASPFTWQLAEKDLLGRDFYGVDTGTPYVHIFCGTKGYTGLARLASEPGTDGTVRQAGAGFNVRKITIDLTKAMSVLNPDNKPNVKRWRIEDWTNASIPVHLADGHDHGSILREPSTKLVQDVRAALDVSSAQNYQTWLTQTDARKRFNLMDSQWQQFIVRACDERGDPITDYAIQLFEDRDDPDSRVEAFDDHVDAYSKDASYRSFLVDLKKVAGMQKLWLSVLAMSGSQWVDYKGHQADAEIEVGSVTARAAWGAWLDLSGLLGAGDGFLSPFTTTLVEFYIDREPKPELVRLSH